MELAAYFLYQFWTPVRRNPGQSEGNNACASMLNQAEQMLGSAHTGAVHSHLSHIELMPSGEEKCHRTFCDDGGSGPHGPPPAFEIARLGWSPRFICESAGTESEDGLERQSIYRNMQIRAL